jgi:hypothetical protein
VSQKKRALIVGIDAYRNFSSLKAAVIDAVAVRGLLARDADETPNYECAVMLGHQDTPGISRAQLRTALETLFDDFADEILFYFSGHGAVLPSGSCLATSDAQRGDMGVAMQEIVNLANASKAKDILLILDCCHSGELGNAPTAATAAGAPFATLREGITVIAASGASQAAVEAGGHGLFTAALLDALDGGAADHMGWVTAPSIYAYVDRRFGGWAQRPIFKMHASSLTVVRRCAPLIDRLTLRKLVSLFPNEDHKFQLDPEFEPEDEHGNFHAPVNQHKIQVAKLLKEYRDVGLVRASEPGEQFFWAARRSHTVELTLRGREYWRLISENRL